MTDAYEFEQPRRGGQEALQSAIYKAIEAGDSEGAYWMVRRLCWVVRHHPNWK